MSGANVKLPLEEERLWTVAEAAAYLNLSKSFVYQASLCGTLSCVRIGSRVRFDPATLRAWVRGEMGGTIVRLPGCR